MEKLVALLNKGKMPVEDFIRVVCGLHDQSRIICIVLSGKEMGNVGL